MIIDTLIFIVLWSFLILGFLSFVTMIDQLLFGGAIEDFFTSLLDGCIAIGETIIKKIRDIRFNRAVKKLKKDMRKK